MNENRNNEQFYLATGTHTRVSLTCDDSLPSDDQLQLSVSGDAEIAIKQMSIGVGFFIDQIIEFVCDNADDVNPAKATDYKIALLRIITGNVLGIINCGSKEAN